MPAKKIDDMIENAYKEAHPTIKHLQAIHSAHEAVESTAKKIAHIERKLKSLGDVTAQHNTLVRAIRVINWG